MVGLKYVKYRPGEMVDYTQGVYQEELHRGGGTRWGRR